MKQAEDSLETKGSADQEDASKLPRWILAGAGIVALSAIAISLFNAEAPSKKISDVAAASADIAESEAPPVTEVIAQLEQKLQEEPDDANAWQMLGWSYFETTRYGEAAMAMRNINLCWVRRWYWAAVKVIFLPMPAKPLHRRLS
jgi:cytochrome c-type biogenesis protein CcmH